MLYSDLRAGAYYERALRGTIKTRKTYYIASLVTKVQRTIGGGTKEVIEINRYTFTQGERSWEGPVTETYIKANTCEWIARELTQGLIASTIGYCPADKAAAAMTTIAKAAVKTENGITKLPNGKYIIEANKDQRYCVKCSGATTFCSYGYNGKGSYYCPRCE